MKLLFLILGATVCFCLPAKETPKSTHDQSSINIAGKQLHYEYDGQIATGLPGASKQFAVNRLNARIVVAFPDDYAESKIAYMQMKRPKSYKSQTMVKKPKCFQPRQKLEEVPLRPELVRALETPVKFVYENSMIDEITLSKQDYPWITNMKRAVLNMIQINWQKRNQLNDEDQAEIDRERKTDQLKIHVPSRENEPESDFFRVMEKTLEGTCEIAYTVNRRQMDETTVNQKAYRIRKSINFENCQKRPEIRYNYRFDDKCSSQETKFHPHEKILKSSTIIRMDVLKNGDDILVQNSTLESQYAFMPMMEEQNMVVAYVKQHLQLMEEKPLTDNMHDMEPIDPELSPTGLEYDQSFQADVEKFNMQAESAQLSKSLRSDKHPFSKIDQIATCRLLLDRLIDKIGDKSRPIEAGAERLYKRSVMALRRLNETEIRFLIKSFGEPRLDRRPPGTLRPSSPENPDRGSIFGQLLAQLLTSSGTRASMKVLLDLTEQGVLDAYKVAWAMKMMVDSPIISLELVDDLLTFAGSSQKVKQHDHLKQTLLLTIASMMNGLCNPNEDILAMYQSQNREDLCPEALRRQYVEVISLQSDKKAKSWYENLLKMKMLENAALTETMVDELEEIINNAESRRAIFLRGAAVQALARAADSQPLKVQKILMPLIMNQNEDQTVRLAAVEVLLRDTEPEQHILHQLVAVLNDKDDSIQVRSLIESTLHQLANSTNPCTREVSIKAKRALRHAKPINAKSKFISRTNRFSAHDILRRIGMDVDFSALFHNESSFPHKLALDVNRLLFGSLEKSFIKIELIDDGLIDEMIDKWMLQKGERASDSKQQVKNRVKEIMDQMGIVDIKTNSQSSNNDPKAYLAIKYKRQTIMVVPLEKTSILKYVPKFAFGTKESVLRGTILRCIKEMIDNKPAFDVDFHEAMLLSEKERQVPTSLGIPLNMEIMTPMVAKVTGSVKFNVEKLDKFSVQVDLNPAYSIAHITTLTAKSPLVETGVELLQRHKVYTPIDAKLSVDYTKSSATEDQLELVINTPDAKRDFVTFETKPTTFVRMWPDGVDVLMPDAEEKIIPAEELERVVQYKRCVGRDTLGMQFCVRNRIQYKQGRAINLLDLPFNGHSKLSLFVEPDIKLTTDARNAVDNTIVIKLNTKLETLSDSKERAIAADAVKTRIFRLSMEHNRHRIETKVYLSSNNQQGDNRKQERLDVELSVTNTSDQRLKHKICMNAEASYPPKPFKVEEVKDMELELFATIRSGLECETDLDEQSPELTVQVSAKQSKEQIEKYKKSLQYKKFAHCQRMEACGPVLQYDYLKEIGDLLEYEIIIKHHNIPEVVKNYTHKLANLFKAKHWLHSSTDMTVHNEPNTYKMTIRMEPANEMMNMTLQAPDENVRIHDMKNFLPVFNVKKQEKLPSITGIPPVSPYDSCSVKFKQISTFDGAKVSAILDTCYRLLVGQCAEPKSFAILVRKISDESAKKEVKIILPDDEINLVPGQQSMVQVYINGEPIKNVAYQKIPTKNNTIEIASHGPYVSIKILPQDVVVYYDSYALNIKINRINFNQVCGLCGHYTGEPKQALLRPDHKAPENDHDFLNSYVARMPGQSPCNMVNNHKAKDINSHDSSSSSSSSASSSSSSSDVASSSESGQDESSKYVEPVKKTKKLENDNDVLFSTTAFYQCPTNARPLLLGAAVPVKYAAVSRDDERSHALEKRVDQNQALTDDQLANFPVVLEKAENLHIKCKAVNLE